MEPNQSHATLRLLALVVAAAKMLYTHESPTGVYFFLAELLDFVAKARHVRFSELRSKARRQFAHDTFPCVVYDCACTFHRFMQHKMRRQRTKLSRAMTRPTSQSTISTSSRAIDSVLVAHANFLQYGRQLHESELTAVLWKKCDCFRQMHCGLRAPHVSVLQLSSLC